jgi:hypothetical protein
MQSRARAEEGNIDPVPALIAYRGTNRSHFNER